MQSFSNNTVLGDARRDLREFVRILDLTYYGLTLATVCPFPSSSLSQKPASQDLEVL